jgi:hypothetical protein
VEGVPGACAEGQGLRRTENVMAANTTPHDMALAFRDCGSVFERGSSVVSIPRHFPDARPGTHRLYPKTRSEMVQLAFFDGRQVRYEVPQRVEDLGSLRFAYALIVVLEVVSAIECR